MSAGGVFQIISNDGKQDKMLMASDLLDMRLERIEQTKMMQARQQGRNFNMDNPPPDLKASLNDVAATHLILFRSNFKPYVAQAMEYQKIPSNSGTNLGSTLNFSLPQFGDFFTDMVLKLQLSQASAAAAALPAESVDVALPAAAAGQAQASFVDGSTVVKRIDESAKVIRSFEYIGFFDQYGRQWNTGEMVADLVRYCDYPMERVIKRVNFDVNGNPLDEYDTYSHVFYRQFNLKNDKRVGYDRNMGQEVGVESKSVALAGGVRYGGLVFNGPQTPKEVQPVLQMWAKLLFWFNQDFTVALPSSAIPYGQRFLNVELNEATKLLFRSPAVYQFVKVTNSYFPDQPFASPDAAGVYDLSASDFTTPRNTWYTAHQLPVLTNGDLTLPTITSGELYANNLFVAPKIHDLYIQKIGFSLVRVRRIQEHETGESEKEIHMNNLKYPTEYIFVGMMPKENMDGANQATDWHTFSKNTHNSMPAPFQTDIEGAVLRSNDRHQYVQRVSALDSLQVKAHGVNLYMELPSQFYNSHIPFTFGDNTITVPRDRGAAMINFALFPGIYQPSGYINISRAREFYLTVKSSVTNSTSRSVLKAEARALNFLLIADGSAVLRYST